MAPTTYADVLAKNVRAARGRVGLQQEPLAARMRALGYSAWLRQAVANVEKGRRRLTAEEVLGLAYALETSMAALIAPATDDKIVDFPSGAEITVSSVRQSARGFNDGSLRWEGNVPVITDNTFDLPVSRERWADHTQRSKTRPPGAGRRLRPAVLRGERVAVTARRRRASAAAAGIRRRAGSWAAACPDLGKRHHGSYEAALRIDTSQGRRKLHRSGFATAEDRDAFADQVRELVRLADDDATRARIGDLIFERPGCGGELPSAARRAPPPGARRRPGGHRRDVRAGVGCVAGGQAAAAAVEPPAPGADRRALAAAGPR